MVIQVLQFLAQDASSLVEAAQQDEILQPQFLKDQIQDQQTNRVIPQQQDQVQKQFVDLQIPLASHQLSYWPNQLFQQQRGDKV